MLDDNIYEIGRKYLRKIKRTGSTNIMAICPFHLKADGQEEHKPSFTMSLTRGVYYCFACQERGTLRTFLRNVGTPRSAIEGYYGPLIEELEKYVPKKADPFRPGVFARDPLPEGLLGMFDWCPTDLSNSGFDEELLHKYEIGFDKDHMRITFPLRDLQGKLVGISGRSVTNEHPKYKIYDKEYERWGLPRHRTEKRTVLWNADHVYPVTFFQKKSKVILVEGFKACLWMVQHGHRNTVALIGLHLSSEHQWILERIGAEVYVMLDSDQWGQLGTQKVAKILAQSLKVYIVELPTGKKQPDELTAEEIQDCLAGATDYYKWTMKVQPADGPTVLIAS